MRKANVNDMFCAARLIIKLDIQDKLFGAVKGENDVEKIGFNVFYSIFEKAVSVQMQNEIYEVLSQPFETEAEEVGKMEISEMLNAIKTCYNMETLVNFTKRAASIMS